MNAPAKNFLPNSSLSAVRRDERSANESSTPVEWRAIPGYEGRYDVSSDGQVRTWRGTSGSVLAEPVIRKQVRLKRYLALCMSSGTTATRKMRTVHSLVAQAFIGPRPPGCDVNHIDGNKDNNRVENLEYITEAENEKHAQVNGLKCRGAQIGTAKLTDEKVREMRREHRAGVPLREIAKKYGTAKCHTCDVIKGRKWKHVPMEEA